MYTGKVFLRSKILNRCKVSTFCRYSSLFLKTVLLASIEVEVFLSSFQNSRHSQRRPHLRLLPRHRAGAGHGEPEHPQVRRPAGRAGLHLHHGHRRGPVDHHAQDAGRVLRHLERPARQGSGVYADLGKSGKGRKKRLSPF